MRYFRRRTGRFGCARTIFVVFSVLPRRSLTIIAKLSAGLAQLGIPEVRQALPLLARRIEICRVEPALECRLERWPFAVEDREPGGVAVATLVHRRLAEHAFVAEAQALRCGARGRVERIAFPLVAPIAQLVEDPAHQEVHRLGRRRGALQWRGVVDTADLDDPSRRVDPH